MRRPSGRLTSLLTNPAQRDAPLYAWQHTPIPLAHARSVREESFAHWLRCARGMQRRPGCADKVLIRRKGMHICGGLQPFALPADELYECAIYCIDGELCSCRYQCSLSGFMICECILSIIVAVWRQCCAAARAYLIYCVAPRLCVSCEHVRSAMADTTELYLCPRH